MKIYLVGGAVRDVLLGKRPKDRDYVVVGSTAEEMLSLGFEQVGADFPVFLHPDTKEEYALARKERKQGVGYHGFEVDFSPTITLEEDLMRRDLTINSMAMTENGTLIDPWGGKSDLENKVLRHTSDAFRDDPVRVLRIARFTARFPDFSIASSTWRFMEQMVAEGELDHLTPERVFAEFKKGLMDITPSRMFRTLHMTGITIRNMPEFFGGRANQYRALDKAAAANESLQVRFGIIGSGFRRPEDFLKWTIPSDCKEVSELVNNNFYSLSVYGGLTPVEKIQLFNRLDLFRRPERCRTVISIAMYWLGDQADVCGLHDIDLDSIRARSVDAGRVAEKAVEKSKIKDAIFDARVASVTRDFKNPQ